MKIMKVILQTVLSANVKILGNVVASISKGYLLLVGFTDGDTKETVDVSKAYVNTNPKYPQLYYKKYGLTNPYKNDERWYPQEG